MKKLFYFILPLLAIVLHGCDPLDDTYTDLKNNPTLKPSSFDYTLVSVDYKTFLPSDNIANKNVSFVSVDSANAYIPTILNKKFILKDNGSLANITYTSASVSFKAADSTFANIAYTVVNPTDYNNSAAVTGTTFKSYSNAQVLLFLKWKYPTPVANQLSLLTYTYFESGATPSAGIPATDSFIYLNGAWQKIYTLSTAQYTSVGRGSFLNFAAADAPLFPSWFNSFLLADASVMAKAKKGDVTYVSYKYFGGGTFQRVLPLTFDGTKWVITPVTVNTLTFMKNNGTWAPDNTIAYTLTTDDHKVKIGNVVTNTEAQTSIKQYGNFDLKLFNAADVEKYIGGFLKLNFPNAAVGQKYSVTYKTFNPSGNATIRLILNSTGTYELVK